MHAGQWLHALVIREDLMSTIANSSAPKFIASLLAVMNRETAPCCEWVDLGSCFINFKSQIKN